MTQSAFYEACGVSKKAQFNFENDRNIPGGLHGAVRGRVCAAGGHADDGVMTRVSLGWGWLVIVLAVLAAMMVVIRAYKWVMMVLGSLALLETLFVGGRVIYGSSAARKAMTTEVEGNVWSGLTEVAASAVQVQWGWPLMFIGALFIVVCARMEDGEAS